jgi:hypothetical protein
MTKTKGLKTIGVVSDLHVGSALSVFPPTYTLQNNTSGLPPVIDANSIQTKMFEYYSAMLKAWKTNYGILDRGVILGDLVQGTAFFNLPSEVTLPNMLEQVGAAAELLKLIPAKQLNLVTGTPVHVRAGGAQYEALVAQYVDRVAQVDGKYAVQTLDVIMNETEQTAINFAHHISISGREWTRGTPLIREVVEAMLTERGVDIKFKLLFRGHNHVHCVFKYGDITCVTLPSWQAASEYVVKNARFSAYGTTIGGYVVGYNEEGIQFLDDSTTTLHMKELRPEVR